MIYEIHISTWITVVYHRLMSREDPQMKIRLSADLKDQIEAASKQSGRSMNAEIVARLEASLAGHSPLLSGQSEEAEQLRSELLALIERKRRNSEVIDYLKESGLPTQELQLAFSNEWNVMGPRAMIIAQRMRELGDADAVKQITSSKQSKKI